MMNKITEAFVQLGQCFAEEKDNGMSEVRRKAEFDNSWFTPENTALALGHWSKILTGENIKRWIKKESITPAAHPVKIGIVAAGNIPLVGLHDLLSVLITGNIALLKLSKDDTVLMTFAAKCLQKAFPELNDRIQIVERLVDQQAVIATGSNNTARYFESYFGRQPHIIRKNRNSIAILNGNESAEDFNILGKDIFDYYGLGCRNVTKIYAPEGYDITRFYDGIEKHNQVLNNSRYANNYTYHKAIFLMNLHKHLDNGFLIIKEDEKIYSPIGCLNYAFYQDLSKLKAELEREKENIQVITSKDAWFPGSIPFGTSQQPSLWDYADGVNTVEFCSKVVMVNG